MKEKIEEILERHKALLSDQESYSYSLTGKQPFIFSTNIKFLNAVLEELPGSFITEHDRGPGWVLNIVIL